MCLLGEAAAHVVVGEGEGDAGGGVGGGYVESLAEHERCIGPVLWAPDAPLPDWWNTLPANRPTVFLSAGSSGNGSALMRAASALREAGMTVMAATAGRIRTRDVPAGVYATEFIPGLKAMDRADLLVCNGGSGLVYQALALGKPVLGLPSNFDQHLVMSAVERQGAGRLLRTRQADPETVRKQALRLLTEPAYATAARRLGKRIAQTDPASALERCFEELPARNNPAGVPQKGRVSPTPAPIPAPLHGRLATDLAPH